MKLAALVVVLGGTAIAQADDKANVSAAFSGFLDNIVADKSTSGSELLMTPLLDEVPFDSDQTALRGMLAPKSKLAGVKVVLGPGGKSAWLSASVPAKVTRAGKAKAESLRATAVLALDGTTWVVKAAHLSAGVPDKLHKMCGMPDYEWAPVVSVPAAIAPTVNAITKTIGKPAQFAAWMSDDPNALVIGSAPKEQYAGGAKIKALFAKLELTTSGDARANVLPDGKVAWIELATSPAMKFCTTYRTLLVLAKEATGWKIVQQHYSQRIEP